MSYILKNSQVYYQRTFKDSDVLISDDGLVYVADEIDDEESEVISLTGCVLLPGLINYMSFNSIERGYLINLNDEIIEYKPDLSETVIGYITEKYNDDILQDIAKKDSVLISNKLNKTIKFKDCPIHITGIKLDEIEDFIKLKENDFDVSCDIDIEQLLVNKEYLKYINEDIIEIVRGEFVFEKLYTNFVKEKLLTLEKVMDLIVNNIGDIFGFWCDIENFKSATLCAYDLTKNTRVNKEYFSGKCLLSIKEGKMIFRDKTL